MRWVVPQCLHWGLGVRREGRPLADAVCADPSSTLKELGAGPSAGEGVGRCVAPGTLRSELGASAWKEEGPDCGRGGVRPPWGGHRPPQRGPRMGFRGAPKRRKLDWSAHPTIASRIDRGQVSPDPRLPLTGRGQALRPCGRVTEQGSHGCGKSLRSEAGR